MGGTFCHRTSGDAEAAEAGDEAVGGWLQGANLPTTEGSMAKVSSDLLEKRAGCSYRNRAGEVQETQLHEEENDPPWVMSGEGVRV
jgi:hypothetical protein